MNSTSRPDRVASSGDEHRTFLAAAADVLMLRGSTAEQFRRYVGEFLIWCEANGVEPRFNPSVRSAYREYLAASGVLERPKSWERRATYINKLDTASNALRQRQRISARRWRTRLIDGLSNDSVLRQGIETLLGTAHGGYRASLRADLAVVLEWCNEHDVDATTLGTLELQRFDAWLERSGRRSRGPAFAARRLHRHFYQPERWWA